MRVLYDPRLPHQREALDAVLGLFEGPAPHANVPSDDDAAVVHPAIQPNALPVDDATFATNVAQAQRRAGLPVSEPLGPSGPDVAVEMETGTGKTYTYVRTMLELAQRHGLRKWLVIVPSLAIREGVLATLRDTREHFRTLLPHVPYRFWAYDGRPERVRVREFATSGTPQIGVLTIAAFNKISNRLRRPDDRFGGRTPLDWVAAVRPGLILDEPHHYGSALSKTSLGRLSPSLTLRYGATHRDLGGLVHRLDAAQAAALGLVKRVEVAPVSPGRDDTSRVSAQIHETIRLHVQRQAALAPRGIKVLSLFFVSSVASYTGHDGLARILFDRHFEALKGSCASLSGLPAPKVRAAYFATKARSGAVETTGDTPSDAVAYQLIMRDKSRLLSMDEPVSFIFSHSALREGWDNPNIFQVCTLAPRTSQVRRRQEIGRGVRLCVDGAGRRVHDPAVDVLSVVPAEPYEAFIEAWRAEHDAEATPDTQRPPTPARTGAKPALPPRPAPPPVPWVELDRDALIGEAVRLHAQSVERGECAPDQGVTGPERNVSTLVADVLARRRPTIALTPSTIDAVVDGAADHGGSPHSIADALARAIAAQGA